MRRFSCIGLAVSALLLLVPSTSNSDEGMWLFNRIPKDYLKLKYGFEPDQAWADKIMRASVRVNVGGSASFVSSNGLVLTNHHVGSDTIQKLSSEQNDYMKDGFLARDLDEELSAPDLELNQLVSIQDVTEKIQAAITSDMSPADASAARRSIISKIEKEATDATGNRCNVVTLFGGGRFHLYEYKKYTDVRLVWAPESAAAFFGGDADNFEYPRYCLDACLFRVYEDGKPAKIEHFLKWNDAGPADGDLIFVSGNPGSTSRIYTHSALEYERDVRLPSALDFIRRREILLQQFGLEGPEFKRQAQEELLGFQNVRKAYTGMIQGLQDPQFMKKKAGEEAELLKKIKADPKLARYASAWDKIAAVQPRLAELRKQSVSLNTQVFNLAQTLVRLAAEDRKDNTERLPQFRESNRESLKQRLLSKAPIHLKLEQAKLADLMARIVERRGANDELAKAMLNGKSPVDRAQELISETRIHDVEFRKQLFNGGPNTIDECKDPMLKLARTLDGEMRRISELSDELQEIETQAYAQIAEAMFAIKGVSVYPDATFTLRLAFGVVKGYEEGGESIPAWTTMAGAFKHEENHLAEGDWKLPESWHDAKDRINGNTPYNFVCTADIIGGNSGSPVVNKEGELVGLIFDGNIQSLTGDFFYSEKQSRAVSVHAGAIREALRNIYDADELADQLGK